MVKQKPSKEENKYFMNMGWGFAGWYFLGMIALIVLVVAAIFAGAFDAIRFDTSNKEAFLMKAALFGLVGNIVLNFVIGRFAAGKVLKKRIAKGQISLADGILFEHFRNKIFYRWFWQSILALIVLMVAVGLINHFANVDIGKGLTGGYIIAISMLFSGCVQRYKDILYTLHMHRTAPISAGDTQPLT